MKRLVTITVLLCAAFAVAQTPRFAISTHATSMNTRDRIPGVGATFGYSFNRRFALESTLNVFPGNPRNDLGHPGLYPVLGAWRSGNILQGQFGLRAGVLQNKKVALFLAVKPGFVTYSRLMYRANTGIGGLNPLGLDNIADAGRQTYFAPFFGAGALVFPTGRMFFRLDGGATVIRYSGFTTTMNIPGSPPGTLPIFQPPAATTHTFQFSTGFGLRFGGSR